MRVKLLRMTEDPEEVLYMASRQCYYPGSVIDFSPDDMEDGTVRSLIDRVFDSGHHSVLEHVTFTFAVDGVSRSLSHQLVRHRIASYSQQSQRYCGIGEAGYVVPPKVGAIPGARLVFEETLSVLEDAYTKLVELGIPAEDARYILPNATFTRVVFTMNIRSLINFFEHRCCMCAQWEIRRMAEEMLRLCRETVPTVFEKVGAKCVTLGYCNEGKKRSCGRAPLKEAVLPS
jgi:thymidylate synthase (FAD)